jgi:hypothetical protein
MGACAGHRPSLRPVPAGSTTTTEVSDPEGDGVRYFDSEKGTYLDGPDLVAAAAVLDLAPIDGVPSLKFRVKLVPSESAAWRAMFGIAVDLDCSPVTPSYERLKGVRIGFSLADTDASVTRGSEPLGRVPLTVKPGWGSGRVGQDLIEVSVPLEWLGRRTHPPLPARKWPEWLGHRGRPLSYRVTVWTDTRGHERVDSAPDAHLPPALLPVPGW